MADRETLIPLTLVIPAYNRQGELDRALTSVAAQDVLPQEIIVVDDGSQPPLVIRQEHAALAVRLIRSDRNAGAAAARNLGLEACRTRWISFLDSDDMLVPKTLGARWRAVLAAQERDPDPKAIHGCAWTDVAEDGTPLVTRRPRASSDPLDFAGGCWFSPGSCVIMQAAPALAAAGPQDATLPRLEDFDWFLSLALEGFSFTAIPLVGALIERKRRQNPARVTEAARRIRRKWRVTTLAPRMMGRINGYLALEVAAAHHYAGARMTGLLWLARSFLAAPRTRLHLSPGWKTGIPAREGKSVAQAGDDRL